MSAAVMEAARRTGVGNDAAVRELLQRVENEYRELPALSVTAAQAERLWNLDSTTCSRLLKILIERGILRRTTSGTYVRT